MRGLPKSLAELTILECVANQDLRQNQVRPALLVPRGVWQLVQIFLAFVRQLENALQKAPLGLDRVLRKISAYDHYECVGRR
jgi:hypothetical protein